MTDNPPPSRHRLAWNGVSIRVDETLEPTVLDKGYLRADAGGRPALELKWKPVRGSFSAQKHLQRLEKEFSGNDIQLVRKAPSKRITRALGEAKQRGFTAEPFSWKAAGASAVGAALHHELTGLALLAQFILPTGQPRESALERAAQALRTLEVHGPGDVVPWAVFGLRARIPGRFVLETFTFRPGHFRLVFRTKARGAQARLTLDRLGPADVILANTPLTEWADAFYTDLGAGPGFFAPEENPQALLGSYSKSSAPPARLMRKLFKRTDGMRARVRLEAAHNKILAAVLSGSDADLASMDDLWKEFALDVAQKETGS